MRLNGRMTSFLLTRPFWAFFVLRIVNAFILKTFYVPDEYWQSLEVAHRMVFGYGHLTWEWKKRIRGYFHPLLFAPAYSTLQVLHLDSPAAVIAAPKVVQAFFAAIGDVYFQRFARKVVDAESAKWALYAYLTNHFTLFSLPRTLSNSLETIFSVVALSYFPWSRDDDASDGDVRSALAKHAIWAALTVVVRPTAIITWIPLWLPRVFSREIDADDKRRFCFLLIRVAFFAVVASVILDSFCYGEFTFVPWEFLKINVFHGVASFYGSHPFHWYFSQGFPVILGPHLLPFIGALRLIWKLKFAPRVDRALQQYREMQRKKEQKHRSNDSGVKERNPDEGNASEVDSGRELLLLKIIFWILVIYSLLGHKEFRFIFTTLPLAMCLVGKYVASLDGSVSFVPLSKKSLMLCSLTILNFAGFFYLASYHQRGNLDAVHHLTARLQKVHPVLLEDVHVLFLLPCHQHPYYSQLHFDVEMNFLTCEPNFELSSTHVDEADRFFLNPKSWFLRLLEGGVAAPSHVIVPQKVGLELRNLFEHVGLSKTRSFFHTHWEMDSRMGNSVDFYEGVDWINKK